MTLSTLAIGSLELTPAFDPNVTEYAATTTNATNKITATASNEKFTVAIESDDAAIALNGTATWKTGENEVTITVSSGDGEDANKKVYIVTVTKVAIVAQFQNIQMVSSEFGYVSENELQNPVVIPENSTIYFNSLNYPMVQPYEDLDYYYNLDSETGQKINDAEPFYMLSIRADGEIAVTLVSDVDLSGQDITIYAAPEIVESNE